MNTKTTIFVFGSNEGGIHGAGAARTAFDQCGAKMGTGFGHTGRSFAIPTKDRNIRETLPINVIKTYVDAFLTYAGGRPDLDFQVTCIGTGLAGLKHVDVAPLFAIHPSNCLFDTAWQPWLPEGTRYWGTF